MWQVGAGGLLTVLGVGLLFWLLGGAMAPTAGLGSGISSTQSNPFLAVIAGLSLASGVTLLGLAAGRWKRPARRGPGLGQTPDDRE
jgi:hypothetical protein